MGIDVEAVRAATPGVANVAHLNNAGAALPTSAVVDTVVAHLRREAEIGGYEAAAEASDRHEAVYASLARLVGGRQEEIALTDSATRAWDAAFYALASRLPPGQVVLTSRAEYASGSMAMAQLRDRQGLRVQVVERAPSGSVDLDAVASALDTGDVGLVCLTHVPSSSGLIEPAAEVGRLARTAGVPFLLDACQSAGQLELDVATLGCDALSATGRKFLRGPRGTGVLWVRHDLAVELEPPVVDLHAAEPVGEDGYRWRPDARRFEQWESSIACRLGLGAAVDDAVRLGMPAVEERVVALGARLRAQLAGIEGVAVHDRGERLGAIVTFTVEGCDPHAVVEALRAERVNVSRTTASYAPLDLPGRGLHDGVVRASVHHYNVEAELDRACELVAGLARSRASATSGTGRS